MNNFPISQPAIEIAAPRGYPGAYRRPSTYVDGMRKVFFYEALAIEGR
jgi:hypothetical protein